MKPFQHINAAGIAAALSLLQQPETAAIAGGTDLLPELKTHIRSAERLVNLKTIPGLGDLRLRSDSLHIGAMTTIAGLEGDPHVQKRFPMLRQAAAGIASPQIRNAGTVGGNLCQRVRCWYYRHPDIRCWLKGGRTCFARRGRNRIHAIFGQAPCVAVHPSDLAPVLTALDAAVSVASGGGVRAIPAESLYRLPEEERRRQTTLAEAEVITAISIPRPVSASRGIYLKVMERAAWSFALVSAAVRIDLSGDRVQQARIVFGGVAGIPWRAAEAEALLAGRPVNAAVLREVSAAALAGAQPLQDNAYKVPLARNLLRRALLMLSEEKPAKRGGSS